MAEKVLMKGNEAIAEAFGMSRSQIARIIPRCEKILFPAEQ